MFQPTPEFLQNFITNREKVLSWARNNKAETLELVIIKNIEDTKTMLQELKSKQTFTQLELWDI